MASIFPFIIIFFTIDEVFSFWVLFSKMLDLLRISILFRLLKYTESDLSRELSKILIGGKPYNFDTFLALTLTLGFTGYIQLLENNAILFENDPRPYTNFFDNFFFIMTTISIVGYNSPVTSPAGKVSIIVLMMVVVVVIPGQSSKMV